jgi:hypothetical protein
MWAAIEKSSQLSNFLSIILHKAIKFIEFRKIQNSKLASVQGARATAVILKN